MDDARVRARASSKVQQSSGHRVLSREFSPKTRRWLREIELAGFTLKDALFITLGNYAEIGQQVAATQEGEEGGGQWRVADRLQSSRLQYLKLAVRILAELGDLVDINSLDLAVPEGVVIPMFPEPDTGDLVD